MVEELDSESFEQAANSGETWIVDFWASWCKPCEKLKPIYEELSREMEELNFGKVDMEEHQNIGTSRGVRALPTLMIVRNGEEVARNTGVMKKEELREWIEENS